MLHSGGEKSGINCCAYGNQLFVVGKSNVCNNEINGFCIWKTMVVPNEINGFCMRKSIVWHMEINCFLKDINGLSYGMQWLFILKSMVCHREINSLA